MELERIFSSVNPPAVKAKAKAAADAKGRASSAPRPQLVDLRRANNCAIMMAQFGKTPPTKLVGRLLALDEEVLGTRDPIAALEGVLQNLPTDDEAKTIARYDGPLERLGVCEAFFAAVLEVPRMNAKLRVFRLKLCMSHSICELQSTLDLVKSLLFKATPLQTNTQAYTNEGAELGAAVPSQISSCSEEVVASKRLQRAFEIVLELGNALNEGTMRGAASGFALSSLSKLMDTKSQDGSTLMHYLCKVRRPSILCKVRRHKHASPLR